MKEPETNVSEIADSVRIILLDTANKRRKEAIRRRDVRCLEAARICERLASSAYEVQPAYLQEYAELWTEAFDTYTHERLLHEIGFRWAPSSASEFVCEYISRVTGTKKL